VSRLVNDISVGRTASMGNPHTRARMHHRFKRGDKPAGRVSDLDSPITLTFVNVRLTIRYNDNLLPLQMTMQSQLEPLRSPRTALEFRFSLHHDPIDQLTDVSQDRLEFGPLGCPTSSYSADFVTPASPRKAGNDDGSHRSCQRKKPIREEHESRRSSLALFRIA
jgi:hypothetical protein